MTAAPVRTPNMSFRIGVVSFTMDRAASVAADAPLRARRAAVIGAFDTRAADAAHRGHALLVAGVVAGLGAAPVGVDGAPRIVVGGLGMARRRGGQQGGTGDHELDRTHGNLPAVAPRYQHHAGACYSTDISRSRLQDLVSRIGEQVSAMPPKEAGRAAKKTAGRSRRSYHD